MERLYIEDKDGRKVLIELLDTAIEESITKAQESKRKKRKKKKNADTPDTPGND